MQVKFLRLTFLTSAHSCKMCNAEQHNEQQSSLLHCPQRMRPGVNDVLLRSSRLINVANNTNDCHQNPAGCADPLSGSILKCGCRRLRLLVSSKVITPGITPPPRAGTCLTCHIVIGPNQRPSSNHTSPLNYTLEDAIGYFCLLCPSLTSTLVHGPVDYKDHGGYKIFI